MKSHHIWLLFPSPTSITDTTQKCLPDKTMRLPHSWQHLGSTESNSPPYNTTTLCHEQPVKPSFSKPRTDSEPGIQGHNSIVQKDEKTGFFSKTDHSTQLSYLSSNDPHAAGARERGQSEGFLLLVLTHLSWMLASLYRNFPTVTRTHVHAKIQGKCYFQSGKEITLFNL